MLILNIFYLRHSYCINRIIMKTIQMVHGTLKIIKPESELNLLEIEKEIRGSSAVSEILLDLSGLDYINSAFIGLLLRIKNSDPSLFGKIRLVNPNEVVSQMLNITQLDQVLEIQKIYPTVW